MSSRLKMLTYAGVLAVVWALCWGYGTFRAPTWTINLLGWPLLYGASLVLVVYTVGLPDVIHERRHALAAALTTVASSTVFLSLCQLVFGARLLPRWVVLCTGLVLVPWLLFCTLVVRRTSANVMRADRVVVVADHQTADEISHDLAGEPERPGVVVGSITVDDARDVDGSSGRLASLVLATRANVVVLDHEACVDEVVVSQAGQLHQTGIRIRTVAMFYEEWLGKLPVSHLERVALMFDIGEVHRTLYGRIRRVLDVPLAVGGLFALALVTPIVLLGNMFANPGPLFFRQARVGRNGDEFQILKFRSMRESNQDTTAGEWTTVNDPRITRFGGFLRRTHIDELPQVINILRGELAVVGPRPEQPHYVEELTEKLPFYSFRSVVTPGLTSWGQVKCGYSASAEETLERLQYEFFHLRHQSLAFDCRVLLRTLRSVVGTQTPGR